MFKHITDLKTWFHCREKWGLQKEHRFFIKMETEWEYEWSLKYPKKKSKEDIKLENCKNLYYEYLEDYAKRENWDDKNWEIIIRDECQLNRPNLYSTAIRIELNRQWIEHEHSK